MIALPMVTLAPCASCYCVSKRSVESATESPQLDNLLQERAVDKPHDRSRTGCEKMNKNQAV